MSSHEDLVKRAEEIYRRKTAAYEKLMDQQQRFLEDNDRKLRALREKNDRLHPEQRSRRMKHRKRIDRRRREHEKRVRQQLLDAKTREQNRLKNRKKDKKDRLFKRRILITVGGAAAALFLFFFFESLIPGSFLHQKALTVTDLEEQEVLEASLIATKPYDELVGISEEQLLWNALMEHFGGNKNAVLGIMCNLHAESRFEASNLEDSNNERWDVTDDLYTEFVNRQSINKKDFLEARIRDDTTGYLTADNQWINLDGGYGYAQYTAYDKKEDLYQFAEQWFGPGGAGEQFKFNIGDPKMQTSFIITLLGKEQYREMNELIAHAGNTVDACYYWLKMYEEPYDPYCDGYYTLAFERAEAADQIKAVCDPLAADAG